MTGSHRWSIYLVGLLFPAFLWAQEKPTLTEGQRCAQPKKTLKECKPKELSTYKTFTEGDKELYAEIYDSEGTLVGVNASSSAGLTAQCSLSKGGKMSCEFIDLLDQAGLSAKPLKVTGYVVYHSDAELAKALDVKEAEITALGLDWRFLQVVVWAAKTPKSKGFVVTAGEARFLAKGASGQLVMPFYESCPHGGRSITPVGGAPAVSVVVALVPTYFSVSDAKTALEKAGYPSSRCNTMPSAKPRP